MMSIRTITLNNVSFLAVNAVTNLKYWSVLNPDALGVLLRSNATDPNSELTLASGDQFPLHSTHVQPGSRRVMIGGLLFNGKSISAAVDVKLIEVEE
jgi:hypothetical protein